MSNRFLSRLKKFTVAVILFAVLTIASLLVTSWALEPQPFGTALAPDPLDHQDAIIQVYGADVWGFRGNFAIHTWIATKARGAADYQVYQVIGWRLRRGRSVVSITEGNPARPWYGSPAILLHEMRGDAAQALIDQVHDAALSCQSDRPILDDRRAPRTLCREPVTTPAPLVSAAQTEAFQRDGAVFLPGLFRDWVDEIATGIEQNLREPGQYAAENLAGDESGRFFDDYCNWRRIPAFAKVIYESGLAAAGSRRRPGTMMRPTTSWMASIRSVSGCPSTR